MNEWTVVVFAYSGESRMKFVTEKAARDYAAKARQAGCLARVEIADKVRRT